MGARCQGGSRIFVEGGANPPAGALTYDFAKISEKLHEIEKIWAFLGSATGCGISIVLMWTSLYCLLRATDTRVTFCCDVRNFDLVKICDQKL